MYLERLELLGFKSFANKTVLEFPQISSARKGITCIVGPNGSGKSNITDAIRWVLGEQSLKMLRSKKAQDVIFAGTDLKTRLGYAEVSLILNNEDHTAPLDYSQIVITRRIFRDGLGEYFLNKNKVRLQDILLFLARSHFGQKSYSIIGQGMVDSILNASPFERKEFFDEATGVRQYQIKKEQALNKLLQAQENLNKAELLIKEIEPRQRSLARQVKKLKKREEVENKLKEYQIAYFNNLWLSLVKQYQDFKEKYQKIVQEHDRKTNEVQKLKELINQTVKPIQKEEDIFIIQSRYQKLLKEREKINEKINHLKNELSLIYQKGGVNFVWQSKHQQELEKEKEQLKKEIKEALIKLHQLEKLMKDQEHQRELLAQKLSQLIRKFKNQLLRIEKSHLKKYIEDLEEDFDKFIFSLKEVDSIEKLKPLEEWVLKIKTKINNLKKIISTSLSEETVSQHLFEDQLLTIWKNKDNLVNEIAKTRAQKDYFKEKIKEKEEELNKIKSKLEEISKKSGTILLEREKEYQQKISSLEKEKKIKDEELKAIWQNLERLSKAEKQKRTELISLQSNLNKKQEELNKITSKLNELKIEMAKLETRKEDLEKEISQELPYTFREKIYQGEISPSLPLPLPELKDHIFKLKRQLEIIGGIDSDIVQEYEETNKRYEFLTKHSSDLKKSIKDLEKIIEELDKKIEKQFNQVFHKINQEFARFFKTFFNGGRAKLILRKEEKPSFPPIKEREEEMISEETEEDTAKLKIAKKMRIGIEIEATPPGKRLKSISMLSGGERALTSLALICAILSSNPSPFVVLDEVDAALDEANSWRFASILEKLSRKTQFIIITHNRITMQKADVLYGVTMGADGVSKLLSLKLEEAEKVAA